MCAFDLNVLFILKNECDCLIGFPEHEFLRRNNEFARNVNKAAHFIKEVCVNIKIIIRILVKLLPKIK